MTVLGVIRVAFFGSALPYLAYRLIRPRPSVIVDRTGIHDHASVACAGFIPWHEVRRYRSRVVGTQPMLAITVTDPLALLARVSAPGRLLMKANQRTSERADDDPGVGPDRCFSTISAPETGSRGVDSCWAPSPRGGAAHRIRPAAPGIRAVWTRLSI